MEILVCASAICGSAKTHVNMSPINAIRYFMPLSIPRYFFDSASHSANAGQVEYDIVNRFLRFFLYINGEKIAGCRTIEGDHLEIGMQGDLIRLRSISDVHRRRSLAPT